MDILLIHAGVIAALAAGIFYWKLIGRHENHLKGLCLGIPAGVYRKTAGKSLLDWRVCSFDAMFQGRQIRMDYRYRAAQSGRWRYSLSWKLDDELEILLPVVQKFWLRLVPKRTEVASGEEWAIGIPCFDDRYVIHSNQPDAARQFLAGPLVEEQFRIMPVYFDRLEVYRGWMKLLITETVRSGVTRSNVENTIDILTRLALDYEQRGLSFRVLTMTASELCPYCRAPLVGEPILECNHCHTLVHAACWKENGQCTTWGCSTEKADPV